MELVYRRWKEIIAGEYANDELLGPRVRVAVRWSNCQYESDVFGEAQEGSVHMSLADPSVAAMAEQSIKRDLYRLNRSDCVRLGVNTQEELGYVAVQKFVVFSKCCVCMIA
jgi:hypothetical protein